MPGRHGKQRVKKHRSKREPLQPMERLVKQSWVGRQNKETTILNELMPVEKVEVKRVNSGAALMRSIKAAPATKKKGGVVGDDSANSPVVRSVATTKKGLAEENWMTKNRYAKKVESAVVGNKASTAKKNNQNKKPNERKILTVSEKELNANQSLKATRNAAEDLLKSLAQK
jgi:hypothetical protein